MKPFDLKAAQRGEPLASHSFAASPGTLRLIGARRNGDIVFKADVGLWVQSPKQLYMITKKEQKK